MALPVVREHQQYTQNRTSFSDTDEERDLCELLALKMEYHVEKKDYVKAFEVYHELTNEIGRSDCTRYYHARDRFYRLMLKYMSEEYKELTFFENIGYMTFEVVENIDDINHYLDKEITLKRDNGQTFKFVVKRVSEDKDVTIVPILPILGEGGRIFTSFEKKNGKTYLTNQLSNGYN